MDRGGSDDHHKDDARYELKVHTCFCGPNRNSCAGSCCNHHAIFDIRDPTTNDAVAHIHKLYAPSDEAEGKCCKCPAFGRYFGDYDTFAVGFPEGSTQEERIMIITSIVQLDFHLFEEGTVDGGGSCCGWFCKILTIVTNIIQLAVPGI